MVRSESRAPASINLKIKYFPNLHEVYINVERSCQLRTVMSASCERLSLELNDTRFVYNGHYVLAEATPDQLEMEDGVVIYAISVIRPQNQLTADPGKINILVHNMVGQETCFLIKKITKLEKLIAAYCSQYSLHAHCSAFLWNGRRLRYDDTADELEMQDGDVIYVMPRVPPCENCCGSVTGTL